MNVEQAKMFLTEVGKDAYGSRWYEGTSGGRGHMGMVGNKLVKFNTHLFMFNTGDKNMQYEAANNLRENLLEAAGVLLDNNPFCSDEDAKTTLNAIKKELGISDSSTKPKKLLERTIIASVLSKIDEKVGDNNKIWAEVTKNKDDLSSLSTRKKDTHFDVVLQDLINKTNNEVKPSDDELNSLTKETIENYIIPKHIIPKTGLTNADIDLVKQSVVKMLKAENHLAENHLDVKDAKIDFNSENSIYTLTKKLLEKDSSKAIQTLFHLQSLGGASAVAYVKAANLFIELHHSALTPMKNLILKNADKLAALNLINPNQFNLENVIKCLDPNGKCTAKTAQEAHDQLMGTLNLGNDGNSANKAFFANLYVGNGGTYYDVEKFFNNPELFNPNQLPQENFFAGTTSIGTPIDTAIEQYLNDIRRIDDGTTTDVKEPTITLKINGTNIINLDMTDSKKVLKQINDFCGNDASELMKRNLILALTQNGPGQNFAGMVEILHNVKIRVPETINLIKNEDKSVTVDYSTANGRAFSVKCSLRIYQDGSQHFDKPITIEKGDKPKKNAPAENAPEI